MSATAAQLPRWQIAGLISGGILLLILVVLPLSIGVDDEGWIDQLHRFVLYQQKSMQTGRTGIADSLERTASFDPYLRQLALIRHLFRTGDQLGTYLAMNRLMDMLERREGGIPVEVADAIWDYCYRITPAVYHDSSRHLKARERVSLEWQRKMQDHSPPRW